MGRAMGHVLQKKLGMRALVDVIPLDAHLVRGSHGLRVGEPLDQPVFVGSGPVPGQGGVDTTEIRQRILDRLGL